MTSPPRRERPRRYPWAGLVAVAGVVGGSLGLWMTPAAAATLITAQAQSGVLTIEGSADVDVIQVEGNGADVLVYDDAKVVYTFPLSSVTSIVMNGNDNYDLLVSRGGLASKSITINGGRGDDEIEGGDGNETLNGNLGDDNIGGGPGKDTINMGGGNDSAYWFPGDGDDVLDGQNDTDTLRAYGTDGWWLEGYATSLVGRTVVLEYNDGGGTQVIQVREVETLDFRLADYGKGRDYLTVRAVAETSVRDVFVDLRVDSPKVDRLTINIQATGTADAAVVTSEDPTRNPGGVLVTGLAVTFHGRFMPNDELRIPQDPGDVVDTTGLVPGTVKYLNV